MYQRTFPQQRSVTDRREQDTTTTPPVTINTGFDSHATYVKLAHKKSLDEHFIEQWRELERNAVEANAFLSPHFIIPALRHLNPDIDPEFIAVYEKDSDDLIALGVFSAKPASLSCPRVHKLSYMSPHSFLGGLLVHKQYASSAVEAMFSYFRQHQRQWHTLRFENIPGDSDFFQLLKSIAYSQGFNWLTSSEKQQVCLPFSESGPGYMDTHLSSKRRANLRRMKRRFAELGELNWQCLTGEQVDDKITSAFLRLEDAGWKGENSSSLLSIEAEQSFFREMNHEFTRHGQSLFMELSLDGQPVAITSNYISGNAVFAFKLGWDPEYAKYSPSLLNLMTFTEHAPEYCSGLEFMDAGASEGSFIDKLWNGRRKLISGYFTCSQPTRLALRSIHASKRLVRRLQRG